MRVKIEMAAPTAHLDGPIGSSRVAAGAVHLSMLPLEGEATHRIVVKAQVMEARLLMAALTGSPTELSPVLIFMATRTVRALRVPALPAVAALTGSASVCSPERPSRDLMIKASKIFEAARAVTVFTAEGAKNTRWVRILMAADAPLNLNWAKALR